jgi:hypothetical protein
LSPDVLSGLFLSSAATAGSASPDPSRGAAVTFSSGGRRAEVASPASKAALTILMERWPCAVSADELIDAALERAAPYLGGAPMNETRTAMTEDLFGGVMHGLIELHTQPPPGTNRPSNTPLAYPLAAFQAERGPLVVNTRHAMHELDALTLDVLKVSNGNRTRDDIVAMLGSRLEAGRATLDAAIAILTRSALLVG